jgi:hypothetical protein
MESQLFKYSMVACLDTADRIYENSYLIIENDRIVDVGLQKDLSQQADFDKVVNLSNRLVMPNGVTRSLPAIVLKQTVSTSEVVIPIAMMTLVTIVFVVASLWNFKRIKLKI